MLTTGHDPQPPQGGYGPHQSGFAGTTKEHSQMIYAFFLQEQNSNTEPYRFCRGDHDTALQYWSYLNRHEPMWRMEPWNGPVPEDAPMQDLTNWSYTDAIHEAQMADA